MNEKIWEIIHPENPVVYSTKTVIDIILENRGFDTEKEKKAFIDPVKPEDLQLKDFDIKNGSIQKILKRIKTAISQKEEIIIYGDYDADGVCATAILWETLYCLTKKVLPYIPDRFTEGYGINKESVEKIKKDYPGVGLIITVDNGITAFAGIKMANALGIDVIVTDHHAKDEQTPPAYALLHTVKTSGSGVAWLLSREILKSLSTVQNSQNTGLELAGIGTISDQLPLTGVNRSIAKYGLESLRNTKRPGMVSLFKEAGIKTVGTYEVNYMIAPRINAMGRMKKAIDSLRFLCTKDINKANELALFLGRTNKERQKVVDSVVAEVIEKVKNREVPKIIVVEGDYHEGVIGLAAGRLAEVFYRPSIVISEGSEFSKASARSISGFNIIEVIRKTGDLIEGGGGHPMAAGFTIKNKNIELFKKEIIKISEKILNKDILMRKLKVDTIIPFKVINEELLSGLNDFNPTGIGNPTPVFATRKVNIYDAKAIGADGKHLKLYLENEGSRFSAIGFNMGELLPEFNGKPVDVAYSIEENTWNGTASIQLNLKDIKLF